MSLEARRPSPELPESGGLESLNFRSTVFAGGYHSFADPAPNYPVRGLESEMFRTIVAGGWDPSTACQPRTVQSGRLESLNSQATIFAGVLWT